MKFFPPVVLRYLFGLLLTITPLADGLAENISVLPANIAETPVVVSGTTEVFGNPRITKDHPCTFWDQEDIEHYKEMLKTSKELQVQFEALKAKMDELIQQPIDIPPPRKGPDGKWLYPGDYFPEVPGKPDLIPNFKFITHLSNDMEAVSDLGTCYVLTGDEKYGEHAKKLLLAYANFTRFGASKTYEPRSAQGVGTQDLDEALISDKCSRGYDLIYNLPSWTPEEHKRIHDELLKPWVSTFLYPAIPDIDKEGCFISQATNRGALGGAAVLAAGYATDDDELVNAALYGITTNLTRNDAKDPTRRRTWPPPHDWIAASADKPSKGLTTIHFAEACIPGGMWVEGSPGYAFYALGSMIDAAEIAWHHGVDLYRINHCILKNMFDFPLLLGYPDLTTPGLNDAHRESMASGYVPVEYEYGYRRYRDPRYLAVINNPGEKAYLHALASGTGKIDYRIKSDRNLNVTHVGSVPPALLYDLDPNEGKPLSPAPSVNYNAVGMGILRAATSTTDCNSLILSYGPAASHGHPDKLQIDLYALGDVLMPSPGIFFPYNNNPFIPNWFHTTVAHNTLTVDEAIQDYLGSNPKCKAHADQVVYGPASTIGIQRGWTDSVYAGVYMDRAVFLTRNYLADLFVASSATPHKYDLAWHIRGELKSDLKFAPMVFPTPAPVGYNQLTNVKQTEIGKGSPESEDWSVTLNRGKHTARLLGASGDATQLITGDGGMYVDFSVIKEVRNARPPALTILERRDKVNSTLYGNVLDFSDSKAGYIKGVKQVGGIEAGYGLLRVETVKGTDLCFSAYKPGTYSVGGLQTDALQAYVATDGGSVSALYLGGGKTLATAMGAIQRDEPGLAFIEYVDQSDYIVGNPSPTDAKVTVTLPALAQLKAYSLNESGQRAGAVAIAPGNGKSITLQLKAGSKVEFSGN